MMSCDTLSNLLRAVRLQGAVFYHVEGVAPWVAYTPPAAEIIPAIMPGTGHMMEFHAVVEGSCWAAIAGEPATRMEAGDVILFPQGDAHIMSSAPGMRAPIESKDLYYEPRPRQLPHALHLNSAEAISNRGDRTEGGDATLICGFLGLDARPFNPLIASLPRVLRVSGESLGADSWVISFMRAVVRESELKQPGGEAVLERMSEMLFVEVLRRHVDSLPEGQTGWLAGMRDPVVGRALSLIHEKPSDAWTVERLCEGAGLSRSSLHERFVQLIGQPPMQYLTQWRMQLASGLLRDTNAKVLEVAQGVGYESEAAFSRAFKRVAGQAPGMWRRARRSDA